MKKILGRDFFNRPTLLVAREMIGTFLVRKIGDIEVARMITETEAYDGFSDMASHARRGKTPRNTPMFGNPGVAYVYFTYGMHWMLNIVCGEKEYPAAVLIRGVEGINGPARTTKFLKIDKRLNNLTLGKKTGLWIEDRGVRIPGRNIKRTPRIGIDYAGVWAQKPWRFVLEEKKKRAKI